MENNSQLIKRELTGYKNIYPLAFILGIIDKGTKEKLSDILVRYNHIYLPWANDKFDTRDKVPVIMRRKGLFITYLNNGDSVYTEICKGTPEDIINHWNDDANWEVIPDLEYVLKNASKIPDGAILPSHLSPSLLLLISESKNITNMADDEDLVSIDNVLKFKDREYNKELASGMGYKVLRRGKSFASQVTQENTIYEIRYDFDLGGEEIIIPDNCVLKFEGGTLCRGVLNGNFNISNESFTKIFDKIKFKGICRNNLNYIDWWVDSYNNNIDLSEVKKDSTIQIQNMFNSGCVNIFFTNKHFYYISNTIKINSTVVINGTYIGSFDSIYSPNFALPCLYTDKKIIMLEFVVEIQKEYPFKSLSAKNIYAYRMAEYSLGEYNENIPMILIKSGKFNNNNLWGCDLECYLNCKIKEFDIDTNEGIKKHYIPSFTGVEIFACNSGFMTHITIDGEIKRFHKAINIHLDNSGDTAIKKTWVTDTTIKCNTMSTYGGNLLGYPIRVFGSHQALRALKEKGESYYKCSNGGFSLAVIWDIDSEVDGLTTVSHSYEAPYDFDDRISNVSNKITDSTFPTNTLPQKRFAEELYKIIGINSNLLETCYSKVIGFPITDNSAGGLSSASLNRRGIIKKIVLSNELDEEINLSEENTFNFSHIFKCSNEYAIHMLGSRYSQNTTFLKEKISKDFKYYTVVFEISKDDAIKNILNSYIGIIKRPGLNTFINTISIDYIDDRGMPIKTENVSIRDYELGFSKMLISPLNIDTKIKYNKIQITYKSIIDPLGTSERVIPKYFIVSLSTDNSLTPSGGEIPNRVVFGDIMTLNYDKLSNLRYLSNKFMSEKRLISNKNSRNVLCVNSYFFNDISIKYIDNLGNTGTVVVSKSKDKCRNDSKYISFKLLLKSRDTNYSNKYLLQAISSDEKITNIHFIDIETNGQLKFYDPLLEDSRNYDVINEIPSIMGSKLPVNNINGDLFINTSNNTLNVFINGKWITFNASLE